MSFELYKGENSDKYYFRLKAKNGEIILSSQGYADKGGAENGIQSVIKNADEKNFEMKTASDGREYFILKAGNGQVIGQSQMYKSHSGCTNGVQSVISNAQTGQISDLTS